MEIVILSHHGRQLQELLALDDAVFFSILESLLLLSPMVAIDFLLTPESSVNTRREENLGCQQESAISYPYLKKLDASPVTV